MSKHFKNASSSRYFAYIVPILECLCIVDKSQTNSQGERGIPRHVFSHVFVKNVIDDILGDACI